MQAVELAFAFFFAVAVAGILGVAARLRAATAETVFSFLIIGSMLVVISMVMLIIFSRVHVGPRALGIFLVVAVPALAALKAGAKCRSAWRRGARASPTGFEAAREIAALHRQLECITQAKANPARERANGAS